METVKGNASSSRNTMSASGGDTEKIAALFKSAAAATNPGSKLSDRGGRFSKPREAMVIPYAPPPLGATPPGSGAGGPNSTDAPNNNSGVTTPPPTSELTDAYVKAWLNGLGNAISPQEKQQLAQVGNDATTLLAFFRAYPEGSPQLNTKIPPAVAAAEKRLLSIAAIRKQLVDPSSGQVTRFTVSAFLKSLDTAAQSAQSDWGSFKNSNAAVQQMAVAASIDEAFTPVMDDASAGAKIDGLVDTQDLQAVATGSGNAGLATAVKQAANLFANPGMFSNVDIAGDDPATTAPDGLANVANFGSFVSSTASGLTPASLIQLVSAAANKNMVNGINVSKLGPDVFANPQNYSGAQKAAVLQQLEDLQATMSAGIAEGDWDGAKIIASYDGPSLKNISPDSSLVQDDLQNKITELSQDPQVQQFISANTAKSLQAITDADPSLKSTMQSYYSGAIQNGSALNDALDAKDSNGNPVSVETGLANFVSEASTYAQALGLDAKSQGASAQSGDSPPKALPFDLQQIVQKSGDEGKLQQAYQNDILSGNELKNALANGTDLGSAVQQFTTDAANFGAALPSKYVAQHAAALQDTFSNTLADSIIGSATPTEIGSAFEDNNGNLDTAKLTAALQQVEQQNPDAFKDSNGQSISPDKIVTAFKYVWDQVRQGAKWQDALYKVKDLTWDENSGQPKPVKPSGPVAKAYSQGMMHCVSALFGAGVLAAKGLEGDDNGDPAATASAIAGSMQVTGGLMEAGSKYAAANKLTPLTAPQLKGIENAGKALGGAAGVIGGALSIFSGVQSLDSGDSVAGGLGIASGVTQAWAGVVGATEGLANLSDIVSFAPDISADTLAALGVASAGFGEIAAGVGVLAFLGIGIYEAIEEGKDSSEFMGQVVPQLNQWGVTGGFGYWTLGYQSPPLDPPIGY